MIVTGPTGSGKSSLAIHLAQLYGGEIVNCDSLQLHRGFDIGTAKTPPGERHSIPHHLLDVLDPSAVPSAGDYGRMARNAVAEISARGRLPIVAGGTGFYLRALLDGLPSLPPRDETLRARLARRRPESLHRLLRRLEPTAAARIHPEDVQKLTRALEVRLLTRNALPPTSDATPLAGYRVLQLGLDPPREQLAALIHQRTRQMFDDGLMEEVRGLLASGCTGEEKPFESIGYKEALAVIRGTMSREAAMEATEIGTRQYAKRQRTWFRRDPRIHWLRGFGNDPAVRHEAEQETAKLLLP
ncbi:MAG: tRNA ((37)-N6)-dimethylallyltransferase MiaA [Acidobacteriota bacterium]